MGHNKWFLYSLIILMFTAIPGGMGKVWVVFGMVLFAGLMFFIWIIKQAKFEEEEQKRLDKQLQERYNNSMKER